MRIYGKDEFGVKVSWHAEAGAVFDLLLAGEGDRARR